MTITKRQFSHLQAMGVELWQLKENTNDKSDDVTDYINIELSALFKANLFTDILKCLGSSIGEVSCDNNTLSLGLLTWTFSKKNDISLTQNHLITPTINVLKSSPLLKKNLWLKLQEHSIL
jgi:DNA polymerase III psi subunit